MPFQNSGLSTIEAKIRLEKFGPNKLPEVPPPSDLSILLAQFKNPLVYILLIASIVTVLLRDYTDAAVIAAAVGLNTILGFFQERRASRALFALKKLIQPHSLVFRDRERKKVFVEEIVPGDICVIGSGDKIPADGKVLSGSRLFISDAVLTGESVPVGKENGDKVFMGTVVTSGNGFILVEATGKETEIGKIALHIQEPYEDTPLKRQLVHFSRQLTVLVILLTAFVFIIGVVSGLPLKEVFTTSVALAVSSIPEGLLVGLTVVLAIGMQKILGRRGLVRNLVSAETLGGVTTICIDKTGTLTQGQMQLVDVLGDKIAIAKQALIANDLDDPLVIALWEWANKELTSSDLKGSGIDDYLDKHERLDSIPFSSKERFFASLNKVSSTKKVLFVNGAPEFLLEWTTLSKSERQKIRDEITKLTSQGMRLIGMAKRLVSPQTEKITLASVKKNLEWVGLVAFSDPVREGVRQALEKVKSAKVKLIIITGDYAQTAVSVLDSLGLHIEKDDEILGSELEKMSQNTLQERLETVDTLLFARTAPMQKLKIVKALKESGEVVAMMGDGVNDAPALKHADIGIVVGDATDVAKESADLILLDSSFATIVSAIEEGRGIFDNIRKIILYLMSDAFEEIVAVIGSILVGLPLPVTAAQILWINLVSDGFPHLALTVDPRSSGIMQIPPRNPRESLVPSWMKKLILIVSLWGGIMGLVLFIFYYKTTGNLVLAQSIAFATLGINSLIYVFSVRTLRSPVWLGNPFANGWLNIAVLGGILMQIFPFLFPVTRNFLEIYPLEIRHWLIIFSASIFMFIMIETLKFIFKEKLDNYNK